jgi:phosphate transport system protein
LAAGDLAEMVRSMAEKVQLAVDRAVQALKERRPDLARQVVEGDRDIDAGEQEIERRCLALLGARHAPAREVRQVSAALKMSTDLERMGDHAADIAKLALRIGDEPLIKPLIDIPRMAHLAREMTGLALRAYCEGDTASAHATATLDDDVDNLYGQVFRELLTYMMEDPTSIRQATHLLFVASHLERIADHATNLAEWAIYMVTGERKELND